MFVLVFTTTAAVAVMRSHGYVGDDGGPVFGNPSTGVLNFATASAMLRHGGNFAAIAATVLAAGGGNDLSGFGTAVVNPAFLPPMSCGTQALLDAAAGKSIICTRPLTPTPALMFTR